MLRSVLLIGAVVAIASPALAESCGSIPIADALPAISDLNGKSADDAHAIALKGLKNVKDYQGKLSTYRQCLQMQVNGVKAQLAAAKDDKEKKPLEAQIVEMQGAYDKTIDGETSVVTEYSNLHAAYCKMGDGLPGCAKPK